MKRRGPTECRSSRACAWESASVRPQPQSQRARARAARTTRASTGVGVQFRGGRSLGFVGFVRPWGWAGQRAFSHLVLIVLWSLCERGLVHASPFRHRRGPRVLRDLLCFVRSRALAGGLLFRRAGRCRSLVYLGQVWIHLRPLYPG